MLNPKILKLDSQSASKADFKYEMLEMLFVHVAQNVENPSYFNWTPDLIKSELDQSRFFVLGNNDDFIAFLAFRESYDIFEIMALGVHEQFRQNGLMLQLIDVLKDEARKASKRILLEVHAANQSAIRLYERSQFKCIGRRLRYYKDSADALLYEWTP